MRISSQVYIVAAVLGWILLIFVLFSYYNRGEVQFRYVKGSNSDNLQAAFPSERKSVLSSQDFIPRTLVQNNTYEYRELLDQLNRNQASQDNPLLAQVIRDHFLVPPSLESYDLDVPNRLEYSNGQTPFIDSRLNYIEGGFYIEAGALNGEKGSNTLFFEKVRKWNGLMVEADPSNYELLVKKHRKAFLINACLSPSSHPAKMTFNKAFNRGRVMHGEAKAWIKKKYIKLDPVEVQCFPVFSILQALNQTVVDFFSLDVEGDELRVLKTIPWDKITIKMLAVEYAHEAGGLGELQKYMEGKGYDTLLKMQRDDGGVHDIIFRKKGLTH